MRKCLFALLFLAFGISCTKKENANTLKVGASPVPHAEILQFVEPDLKEKGIDLIIIEMDDYNLPNRALSQGEIHANFFQHIPFMEEQIKQFGYSIACDAKIHLEPMGIYSKKYRSLEELPQGTMVALPNDPTNEYRALKILEDKKLIQLRKNIGLQATVADIISNPKNFRFKEIDAAMLPRILQDVGAAAIPTNFALQAKLNPARDALAIESEDSPYVNIIAIRDGEENNPKIQALREVMLTEKMRTFILDKYQGAIIPIIKK